MATKKILTDIDIDGKVISNEVEVGGGSIAGSQLTSRVTKTSTGTEVNTWIDTTTTPTADATGDAYGAVIRAVGNGSNADQGLIGANTVGRSSGTGGAQYAYGILATGEQTGSGDVDFITGVSSRAASDGDGVSTSEYVRGVSVESVVDNSDATVDYLQGTHISTSLIDGEVGEVNVELLDWDYTAGTVTGDLSYIRIQNDNYTGVDGTARAIHSLAELPSLFSGSIEATSFIKTDGTSSQFLKADGSVDSSTYNNTIGTDLDLNTSGYNVVDQLNMTDGVITSFSTRGLDQLRITDDRDVKPDDITMLNGIQPFFSSLGGMTGNADANYQDMLVLNSWSDASGGNMNAITIDKTDGIMRLWNAAIDATTWGTAKQVYTDDDFSIDDYLPLTGGSLTGNLSIDIADDGGDPATTAMLYIDGFEGRGAGIKIKDSVNSATNANNREWFIGSGYSQDVFNIGYASDAVQSSYAAQNKFSVSTVGDAIIAGTLEVQGTGDSSFAGNVGIGTDSPSYKFTAYGNSADSEIVASFGSANDQNEYTAIGLSGFTASNGATKAGLALKRTATYGGGELHFLNNNTLDNSDMTLSDSKMMIDSNGKVGIGTTSPNYNLQVGDGTEDSTIAAYYNDGTYTRINGYGLYMSRTASYIRPVNDLAQSLYIGTASNQWATIRQDANASIFLDDDVEIGRFNSNGFILAEAGNSSHELIFQSKAGGTSANTSQANIYTYTEGDYNVGMVFGTQSKDDSGNEFVLPSFRINTTDSDTYFYHGIEVTDGVKITSGTSSQFLKADGTLDSNTYLTSSGYLLNTTDTLTGDLTITGNVNSTYDGSDTNTGAYGINRTLSGLTANVRGYRDNTIITAPGNNTVSHAGIDIKTQMTQGTFDHVTMFQGRTSLDNADVTDFEGLYMGGLNFANTSNVTNYVGVTVENPTAFSGTITNFIGTKINAPIRTGGTITNFYGLKIEDNVSATNKWAIYSDDDSVNSKMLGQLESGDITVQNTTTAASLNLNSSSTGSGGNYIHAKKSDGSNQWVLGSNNSGDDRVTLKQYNAANIIFQNNSGDAMVIDTNGNVGIGTDSPGSKLDVDGKGSFGDATTYALKLKSSGGSRGINIISNDGTSRGGIDWNTGDFIIRNSSDDELLKLNYSTKNATLVGNVTATNFILSSDKRLKNNVEEVDNKHIDVNWKTFEMNSNQGQKRYGVIAQELEEVHPEFVRTNDEGMKSVAYVDLLIAKISELESRLEKAGI